MNEKRGSARGGTFMSKANHFICVPTTCPDLPANRDTTRQGGMNMPGIHKNPTISFRVS